MHNVYSTMFILLVHILLPWQCAIKCDKPNKIQQTVHDQPFVQAAHNDIVITLVGSGWECTCGQFPGREGDTWIKQFIL